MPLDRTVGEWSLFWRPTDTNQLVSPQASHLKSSSPFGTANPAVLLFVLCRNPREDHSRNQERQDGNPYESEERSAHGRPFTKLDVTFWVYFARMTMRTPTATLPIRARMTIFHWFGDLGITASLPNSFVGAVASRIDGSLGANSTHTWLSNGFQSVEYGPMRGQGVAYGRTSSENTTRPGRPRLR